MAPTSLSQRAPKICDTPACHALSERLLEIVNLNVDPCSDFFQYTCGSWLNTKPVKESPIPFSILQEMEYTSRQAIIEFLSGSFEDLQKDIETDDESFQTHNQTEVDKKNFEMIKDYYGSCMNFDARSKLGASSLFPMVVEIENSLLPITENINPDNVAKALARSALDGIKVFFSFSVGEDVYYNGHNTVDLGLPKNNPRSGYRAGSEDYRVALVHNITDTLGAPPSDNAEYEKLIYEESQVNNFTLWSSEKILAAANNFMAIESQLELILEAPYDLTDNYFTLEDLKSNSTNINWDVFFSELAPKEWIDSNPSLTFLKDYVTAVDKLISSMSPELLQEYFVIKSVLQKLDSLKFPEPDMFIAPDTKDTSIYSDEELCSRETSKRFKHIVTRFFVLKTFGASKEKKHVEDMADSFHSIWIDEIPNINWVDDATKVGLLEKAKAIGKRIAYSTTSPDIRDPSILASFYSNVTIQPSYFETTRETIIEDNKKLWDSLGSPFDKDEWLSLHFPEWVNALYSPLRNTIEIPVGMLQKPFYSPDYPQYMNYGGLGVTVAHEYMHSVDSNMIAFNATGQIEAWFSEEAAIAFSEKTQCFVDQYSQFAIFGASNRRLKINGNFTLAENMSDNSGLRIAYEAYQKYVKNNVSEGILPGFENFTEEQLFFIAHSLFTCGTGQKSLNELSLTIDTHSPLYHRNIITYQNSYEFAEAFKCPVGSPMNPNTTKCKVW